jgi:hypothetical protein
MRRVSALAYPATRGVPKYVRLSQYVAPLDNRVRGETMRRGLVIAAAAVMVGGLLGCGGSTKTVTETIESEKTTDAGGEVTPSEEPQDAAANTRSAEAGGIEVTISNAGARPSFGQMNKAPQGGHYVYVETDVLNESAEGIDLTCSDPLEVKLAGAEGRRYDPVEELWEVPGNPECNEQLQPGFSHRMTWVFLVPPRAEPDELQVNLWTDHEDPPAAIAVSVG